MVLEPAVQSQVESYQRPKKMVLHASLLNTQHYNVWIKSKLPIHLGAAGGCPRDVMVKAMDCGIVVREFVFQSRYNVHFRVNTLGKGMNPLILPAIG